MPELAAPPNKNTPEWRQPQASNRTQTLYTKEENRHKENSKCDWKSEALKKAQSTAHLIAHRASRKVKNIPWTSVVCEWLGLGLVRLTTQNINLIVFPKKTPHAFKILAKEPQYTLKKRMPSLIIDFFLHLQKWKRMHCGAWDVSLSIMQSLVRDNRIQKLGFYLPLKQCKKMLNSPSWIQLSH